MFTGIVAAVGRITTIEPFDDNGGVRLQIDSGGLPMGDVAIGDSIAINGACMTVTQKTAASHRMSK
jgi:riboflavin synthase